MMKSFKKAICILLTALMLLTPGVLSAFAEGAAEPCPHIYIHGFMSNALLEDKDNPNSKVLWPPDTDALLNDIKDAAPTLAGALLVNNWEKFGTIAIDLVKPYFEPTYLSDDGTCPNNSGVYFRYPSPNAIPKNGRVDFKYDWRLDPMLVADDLNDFIEYVRTSTGAQKVNLSCHSLGGIIALTYLSKYGIDKVKGICFNTTAIYGETYTGDLMRGDIVFDADAIDYYLRYVLEGTENEGFVTELIRILNETKLLDLLAKKANGLTRSQKERVCREVLLPMFGNWLTIWSMVPDQDVEISKETVFNQICADEDRTVLQGKIDAFNTVVRANKLQTLQTLNENANVYVISRYGYSSVPVTPSFNVLSDGVVDTRYSSFGATASDYDKTLSKAQTANVPAQYISPDRRVDASTCLFPEQTWFIRNMKHSLQAVSLAKMIDLLLAQEEQANVDTFEQYPRFLVYDAQTDTLSPDTTKTVEESKTNIFDRLLVFFQQLRQILEKLFARFKTN